jgi:hypothetical protein
VRYYVIKLIENQYCSRKPVFFRIKFQIIIKNITIILYNKGTAIYYIFDEFFKEFDKIVKQTGTSAKIIG